MKLRAPLELLDNAGFSFINDAMGTQTAIASQILTQKS